MKWPVVSLGVAVDINPRNREWSAFPDETDVTFVPMSAVSEFTASISEPEVRPLGQVRRGYTPFSEGDLLFAKITPCMENGKVALAAGLLNGLGFGSTEFHVLRPMPVILPQYLLYFIRQQNFRHAAKQRMQGAVGQQRVPENFLRTFPIPLPPLSEQRRIVEILEQADALRKMRAMADAKVIRIMHAIFIKIFGNPDAWISNGNTRPLACLVEVYGGGTPSKQNPNFWEGEIPWVSPKDMKQDIIYDSADHISPFAVEQTNLKYINPGTVLIVVRGMILSHTVPIALTGTRLTINQDIKALETKSMDINPTYLYAALRVSDRKLLSQVRTAAHGTRKIDTEELLQLPIMIPPRRDSDRFHRMMGEYNGAVSRILKIGRMIERLFENLLHRAFSSDLTAKWREGHMRELLAEMKTQARHLESRGTNSQRENVVLQESLF
jgi:type I restriction enzyme, S subunit